MNSTDEMRKTKNTQRKLLIVFLIIIVAIGIFAVVNSWNFYQIPKQKSPNQLLSISDNENDFIFEDVDVQSIETNLAPVDIINLEAINDIENFKVTVTTKEPLPDINHAPSYPHCYVCTITVMADNDGNKFAGASIIIDKQYGWEFFEDYAEDENRISYEIKGNKLTFNFPLDMTDWKGIPDVMSFRVLFGYENNGRIHDMIPNQEWGDNEYQDYKLWQK